MMTHGSLAMSPASSPAVIRTSVMAASPVYGCSLGGPELPSRLRQHLAQLLGGGRHDGDEIGLAQPPLGAMTLEVAARAAMEHRRMRHRDAGIADPQPQRDDPAPVAVVGVVGIVRQRHRLLLELGMELAELRGLL